MPEETLKPVTSMKLSEDAKSLEITTTSTHTRTVAKDTLKAQAAIYQRQIDDLLKRLATINEQLAQFPKE